MKETAEAQASGAKVCACMVIFRRAYSGTGYVPGLEIWI